MRLRIRQGHTAIISLCDVSKSEVGQPESDLPWEVFLAVWDTGATISAISKKVVCKCGLTPMEETLRTRYADGRIAEGPKYLVSLRLPSGASISSIEVGSRVGDEVDVLIGMDVIARGDFLVLGGGEAWFRYPSVNDGGAGMVVVVEGEVP